MKRSTSRLSLPCQAGVSLVEVCIFVTAGVLLLFGLHQMVLTSMRARRAMENEYAIQRMASMFASRLRRVPFGEHAASLASPDQLAALFDDDDALGTVSFTQLRQTPLEPGHGFTTNENGLLLEWRVKVTNDLNQDGDVDDAREARPDLYKIIISCNGRRIVESLRAAEPAGTVLDTDADYLSSI